MNNTPRILQKAQMERELERLLNSETEIRSDTYLLSLYFPMESLSRIDAEKHVKSYLLEALKSDERLLGPGKLHQKIVESVLEKMGNTADLGKGFAVFMEFMAGESSRDRGIIGETALLALSKGPEREVYIGKTFDLDQIVWLTNTTQDAVVVSLKREEAGIYTLEREKLTQERILPNEFIKEREQEYLETYSPSPTSGAMYHGSDSEKIERVKEEESRKFIQHIAKVLKEDIKSQKDAEFLVVFYSSSFSEYVEKMEKELRVTVPEFSPIFLQRNIPSEKKLLQESIGATRERKKVILREQLEKARDNRDRYSEGWNDVAKAANDRRIDTLFINPLVRKRGYVLEKELVYTRAVKDSREVRNIGAWIVRSVVKGDGKIVIADESVLEAEVAARLRY